MQEVVIMSTSAHNSTANDFVKIPKQEYNLLKEVYRTVQRQAFLVRLDEAEKNLASGKTKKVSVDDLIASI
jgi:hypothetical protein